jgi:hypothetical protein
MDTLDRLRSRSIAELVLLITDPEAIWNALRRRPEIIEIKKQMRTLAIPQSRLRGFVRNLLADFRQGRRFPHEHVLAALAVVLDSVPSAFADEFLRDLSRLKVQEFPISPRIAKVAVRKRNERVVPTKVTTHGDRPKLAVDKIRESPPPPRISASLSELPWKLAA